MIDKREVVYHDKRTEILFPGCGQPLDSDKKEPSNRDENARIRTLHEMSLNPGI